MEVAEVIKKCEARGLQVTLTKTGYRVTEPKSGALITTIHKTPSDQNWFWNIKRHFRLIGIPWDDVQQKSNRTTTKGWKHKRKPAVDLEALARAQAAARAAGQRVPRLEDLDESTTSEFWTREKPQSGVVQLSEVAQNEVIDNMAARAQDARVRLVRSRLKTVMQEKKVGSYAEFARVALKVAETRNMRAFKTENAGSVIVGRFVNDDEYAPSIWALNLIEATIDNLNGLKWGIDESRKQQKADDTPVAPEPEPEPEVEPLEVELVSTNGIRDRYAEVLLTILENRSTLEGYNLELILSRLDQLVGITVHDIVT